MILVFTLCTVFIVTELPDTALTVGAPLIPIPDTSEPVLISRFGVSRVRTRELLLAAVVPFVTEVELVSGIVKLNAVTPFFDSKKAAISSTSVFDLFVKASEYSCDSKRCRRAE